MDLQQLINEAAPGSIWMRTDGSRARVLAITNLSLPAESQQKYVPVVVYIGPSGKVFSRPLKDFAGYFPTWLGHDSEMEDTLKGMMTPLGAPKVAPVATSDDDSIDMSDDAPQPRDKPTVQVRAKTKFEGTPTAAIPPSPPSLMRAAFQIGNDDARKTPSVTVDQLSHALRVYSQVPDEHLGLVVHKLSFELSPNLTIDGLKEVFSPDDWVNTVDMFRIGTPVSDETVGVDAFIGVYPEFTRNVLYGTVYVGVDMVPAPNSIESPSTTTQAEIRKESTTPELDTPQANPVADSSMESQANEVPSTADEPVLKSDAEAVANETIPETATSAESGEPVPEALVPPVKVKKKRGPKPKKKVEAVVTSDDTEIDVENLS
jgi:hypothetical protein